MDKRKKFHKALLKLYCPPPSPAEPLAVDSASLALCIYKPPSSAFREIFNSGIPLFSKETMMYLRILGSKLTMKLLPFLAAKEEPLEFPSLDDHLDSDTVLNNSENGGESESQRLTRAQRKRIRRRKLKEAASVRRKFIGPMLPPGYGDDEQRQSTD